MTCDLVAQIVLPSENTITVEEFAEVYNSETQMTRCCLVDCRNEVQFNITHLDKARNLPFKAALRDPSEIRQLAEQHDKVYIMCRRGIDSKDLTDKLLRNSEAPIPNVVNVQEGIEGWSLKIDTSMPHY